MRIAQLAPLAEAVPPSHYGGTERVIAVLTDELVRRGHDVTLFASGDSHTGAQLVPVVPHALRGAGIGDGTPAALLAASLVGVVADAFDIIHSHLDVVGLPLGRQTTTPLLHTLHGRLDLPAIQPLFAHYTDARLVAISHNQAQHAPDWNWLGTVYNGIDLDTFAFQARPGSYLAFVGRMAPEKGVEDAIAIARRVGLPLKVAAKVGPLDQAYYEARVKPLLAAADIEYVGEITEAAKSRFLGEALALLFPIRWPEPFGLVMVEAMATGTPVIARRGGAVAEVLVDGVTGFIGESNDDLVQACARVAALDRRACRARVAEHFSAAGMADGYEGCYRQLLGGTPPVAPGPLVASISAASGRAASLVMPVVSKGHGAVELATLGRAACVGVQLT